METFLDIFEDDGMLRFYNQKVTLKLLECDFTPDYRLQEIFKYAKDEGFIFRNVFIQETHFDFAIIP